MRLVLRFCVRFGAGVFERLSGIYKGSLCGLAKEYEDLLSMIGRRTSKPMVCVHSQCKCLCCFVPRSFWALDTKPFRDRLCLQARHPAMLRIKGCKFHSQRKTLRAKQRSSRTTLQTLEPGTMLCVSLVSIYGGVLSHSCNSISSVGASKHHHYSLHAHPISSIVYLIVYIPLKLVLPRPPTPL